MNITLKKILDFEFIIDLKKIIYLILVNYLSYLAALVINNKINIVSFHNCSMFHFFCLYECLLFLLFVWYQNLIIKLLFFIYFSVMTLYITVKQINNNILFLFFFANFIFALFFHLQ